MLSAHSADAQRAGGWVLESSPESFSSGSARSLCCPERMALTGPGSISSNLCGPAVTIARARSRYAEPHLSTDWRPLRRRHVLAAGSILNQPKRPPASTLDPVSSRSSQRARAASTQPGAHRGAALFDVVSASVGLNPGERRALRPSSFGLRCPGWVSSASCDGCTFGDRQYLVLMPTLFVVAS